MGESGDSAEQGPRQNLEAHRWGGDKICFSFAAESRGRKGGARLTGLSFLLPSRTQKRR